MDEFTFKSFDRLQLTSVSFIFFLLKIALGVKD